MTNEEIIKALRCWTGTIVKDEECAKCSFVDTCTLEDIVDVVEKRLNELKSENAALRERLDRSVEFPCKVGETVYYYKYFCDYKGCTDKAFCCGCKEMIERERQNERYIILEKPFKLTDLDKIGKKVFLTKAEAESRLKELQEGKK